MANMNTLFKKGYLLAGVIIAANMFIINEMKATDKDKKDEILLEKENEDNNGIKLGKSFLIEDNDGNASWNQYARVFFNFLLYWENYFNFFGTLFFSVANNYFKLWDYNPGKYRQFGCRGWRSKRLLNGIFQFEGNFNLCRGISWGFLGFWFLFVQKGTSIRIKTACSLTISSLFFLIINNENRQEQLYTVEMNNKKYIRRIAFFLLILQGFVSIPMTLHISNFSISISLDSILWELVAKWAREKKVKIHLKLMNIWVDKNKKEFYSSGKVDILATSGKNGK